MTNRFSNSYAVKVPLGTMVQTNLISKVDVADGTLARVVPIYPDVVIVGTIYSENPKGVFLCTQEQALQIGASPRYSAVVPVFRLDTNANGEVFDQSNVKLEYLRISENNYKDLAIKMSEMEGYTSLVLKKVKKSAEGRDYSYIEPTVSNKPLPQFLYPIMDDMRRSLKEDQVWGLIIADIARPFDELLRALNMPTEHESLPSAQDSPQPQSVLPNQSYSQPQTYGGSPSVGVTPTPSQAVGGRPLAAAPVGSPSLFSGHPQQQAYPQQQPRPQHSPQTPHVQSSQDFDDQYDEFQGSIDDLPF